MLTLKFELGFKASALCDEGMPRFPEALGPSTYLVQDKYTVVSSIMLSVCAIYGFVGAAVIHNDLGKVPSLPGRPR